MRAAMIMLALAMCATAAPAGPSQTGAVQVPRTPKPLESRSPDDCPRATSYFAGSGSSYRGDRIAPQKLAELPPAVGFMAVYRTQDGCADPMTVVEYRTGRRP